MGLADPTEPQCVRVKVRVRVRVRIRVRVRVGVSRSDRATVRQFTCRHVPTQMTARVTACPFLGARAFP